MGTQAHRSVPWFARSAWVWAMAVALLTAAVARAQTGVADFSGGPPGGAYSFNSWTPKALPDLLRGNGAGEVTPITGHLFLPAGTDKVPAVIFMHGSGGIYGAMLEYWPQRFNAAGFAMLALDSFGPRGVKSTAEDQSQVPFAADVADVFAALRLLATHPRIDASRIALLGTSRGGIAVQRAATQRVVEAQRLPAGLQFAAYVPVYSGGCVGAFRLRVAPGVFAKAPQFWVHGDADDYALMPPCKEYAEAIGKAGTPVEFLVIPGAGHKFDGEPQRKVLVRGAQMTRAECPLEMDLANYASYDRFTGQRLTADAVRDVTKASCSAIGASVEGNHGARDKAAQAIVTFLRATFTR